MAQSEPPPESVPISRWVAGSQIPEPEEPSSVTPALQITRQCVLLPPVPMQLLIVVSALEERLMDFSSPLGWWMPTQAAGAVPERSQPE